MGVTFDGDRSRKLLWFAKKLLHTLKMLDLPVKALKYNGFLVRVWKMGGLTGGRVTAPMGAAVAYTNRLGTMLMTADHWSGVVDSRSYFHGITKQLTSGLVAVTINKATEEEMVAAGYATFPIVPSTLASPYYGTPGGVFPPSPTTELDAYPTPGLFPVLGGEAFWTSCGCIPFIDIDGDDVHDGGERDIFEASLNFYNSDGNYLGNRMTLFYEEFAASIYDVGAKSYIPLPSEQIALIQLQTKQYFTTSGPDKIAALYYTGAVDVLTLDIWFLSVIIKNMPSGLQAAILNTAAVCSPIANHVFSNTVDGPPALLTAIDLTDHGLTSGVIYDYFDANPGDEHWRLSLHFHTWGESTVDSFDSTNFMGILTTMADVHSPPRTDPANDWDDAAWMMMQMFSRPNHNFTVPYDNATWHDENGDVYTWSRLYGAFKFSRSTGASVTSVNVSSEVTGTDGVRPTITHAGDGVYLMVSEELNPPIRVKAIHVGDPLISWTSVPLPVTTVDDGITTERYLVHVRPVKVTAGEVVLLGIIEKIVDGAEGVYHLAFLRYTDYSGTPVGEWYEMAQLPTIRAEEVIPGDNLREEANWSVTLFGEGEYVYDIPKYIMQHPIMANMPIPPDYAAYETGMP